VFYILNAFSNPELQTLTFSTYISNQKSKHVVLRLQYQIIAQWVCAFHHVHHTRCQSNRYSRDFRYAVNVWFTIFIEPIYIYIIYYIYYRRKQFGSVVSVAEILMCCWRAHGTRRFFQKDIYCHLCTHHTQHTVKTGMSFIWKKAKTFRV